MKKGDIILISCCVLICILFLLIPRSGNCFTVYLGGEAYGTYPLDTDTVITVNGVKIQAENGKVFVSDSPCPDKVCLKSGKISKGSIACLPQKVVIVISSAHFADGVTG